MARLSKEEEKKKHVMTLQVEANKRYKQKNNIRKLAVDLDGKKIDEFSEKLKKEGITKKQVIEAAIDNFLAN